MSNAKRENIPQTVNIGNLWGEKIKNKENERKIQKETYFFDKYIAEEVVIVKKRSHYFRSVLLFHWLNEAKVLVVLSHLP